MSIDIGYSSPEDWESFDDVLKKNAELRRRVAELEASCTCRRKLDGPPTEPGWYWQVSTGTMFNGPRKIEQVDIDDGWPGAFSNEVTWYGPICEPEDANERDER
ncbi:MAG: hypothetical protein AB7E55_33920 [Pigmentiphaga sp.]